MKLCKIVVALATVCGALALHAQPDTTLRPIHPDQWPKIENHIRNSWDRYVDTVATLPAPFSFALNSLSVIAPSSSWSYSSSS